MKKEIIVAIAVLIGFTNVVMGNVWRVGSDLNSAAHFTTLNAALASTNVVDGDTIYLEPNYLGTETCISKKLCIIGPGYNHTVNGLTMMNVGSAIFTNTVSIVEKCHIIGCVFNNSVDLAADSIIVERCNIKGSATIGNVSQRLARYCKIKNNRYRRLGRPSNFLKLV